MAPVDVPQLTVDGRIYAGWTEVRVSRGMDRAAGDFTLSVAERWPGQAEDWPILPFAPVEIRFGADLVLTGYVDRVMPALSAGGREVKVSGRSKTADLVDCTPLVGAEFRRATLPAIARALAQPFGIEVVEEVTPGAPFALEAVDRTDTAWATIERLARMRGVLATDDAAGRLVLTRTASRRASGALVQGRNVEAAAATINVVKRFSAYIVLSQQPGAAALDPGGDGDEPDGEPGELPGAGSAPGIEAIAEDPDVPRFRPRVLRAEGQGGVADARARAKWAASTARGLALQATVTVAGWRQPDGRLWQANELAKVVIPYLRLDHEMIIMEITYLLSPSTGRTTELVLCPPEALTLEPEAAPARATGGAAAGSWADVRPIR